MGECAGITFDIIWHRAVNIIWDRSVRAAMIPKRKSFGTAARLVLLFCPLRRFVRAVVIRMGNKL